MALTAGTIAAAVLGLATCVVLWRLSSGARLGDAEHERVAPANTEHGRATAANIEREPDAVETAGHERGAPENSTRVSRRAVAFARVLMIAGAVVVACGALLVLARPGGTADAATVAAVLGGPAIFLVGDLVFHRAVTGRVPVSRLIALGCLAVLACIGFALPALVLAALALAVLLLLSLAASGWFRLPSFSVRD